MAALLASYVISRCFASGDIRRVPRSRASDASEELRDLFTFRFPSGSDLAGHSLEIFLSAVEANWPDFQERSSRCGGYLAYSRHSATATLDDSRLGP